MKNTLTLIGAIAVAVGVLAAAAIVVKKYTEKCTKKKKDEALFDCDGTCCDNDVFGEDEESESLNWEDIPVEDDEDSAESVEELNNLDAE